MNKPSTHEDLGPPPPYSEAAPAAAYYYPQQQQVSLVVNSATDNNLEAHGPSETNSNLPSATATTTAADAPGIFSDISQRQAFVRKVYGIVSAQLVTVVGFITIFVIIPNWGRRLESDLHLAVASFFTFPLIIIIGCCACCCSLAKKAPGSIVCVVLHTLALSFVFVIISAVSIDSVVFTAVVVTAVAGVSLTIFAATFATCGGILFATGIILVSLAILVVLSKNTVSITYLECVSVGALIFSTFLVYDTQLMVMGKHRISASISSNDYVFAVHTFHVDITIVWLPLYLCSIFIF